MEEGSEGDDLDDEDDEEKEKIVEDAANANANTNEKNSGSSGSNPGMPSSKSSSTAARDFSTGTDPLLYIPVHERHNTLPTPPPLLPTFGGSSSPIRYYFMFYCVKMSCVFT